jgi:hypothetical protein
MKLKPFPQSHELARIIQCTANAFVGKIDKLDDHDVWTVVMKLEWAVAQFRQEEKRRRAQRLNERGGAA